MVLGVIPARRNSKSIVRKNLYPLNGRSLIEYTIDAAKKSCLDDYIISTDDEEIRKKYRKAIWRPCELALDDTPMVPVIQHAVHVYEKSRGKKVYAVVTLQPTSPLRTAEDIDESIRLFKESGTNSLYSGYYLGIKYKDRLYDKHKEKPHFQRNGAIFITNRELLGQGKLWSGNVIKFEMPKYRSIDIDDLEDMFIAEAILKHREATK